VLDSVSGAGNVSFRNSLVGATQDTDGAVLAWTRSTAQTRLVAREGSPAPGWTPSTSLYGSFTRTAIDNNARVLIAGNPKPTLSGTPGTSKGLWRSTDVNTTLLLRFGQAIPDTSPNPVTSFDEFGGVSDDGSLSLPLIEGNFPTATDDRFAVVLADNSIPIVLDASVNAPWAAGLAVVTSPPTPAIANGGAWLARSRATGGPNVFVRKLNSLSPLTVIATTGASLPGLAAGQTLLTLGSSAINDNGVAAISCNITGLESALWRIAPDGTAALITKSGAVADTPNGQATISQVGVGVTSLVMNNAGDILFVAAADVPSVGNTTGLWFASASGGLPRLVAAQNQLIPGTNYTITTLSTNGFALDSLGRAVLPVSVELIDGGIPVRAILTWSSISGQLRPYAIATIDAVTLAPGDTRTLQDVFFTISIANGAGYTTRKAIADDGFFVWQASFVGSTTALLAGQLATECDTIDFNRDSLFPDDNDIIDFLSVLAGGPCSTGQACGDIDFNNDGLFPSDDDLIAFLRVLAGGNC
jgi:hypothetical protein